MLSSPRNIKLQATKPYEPKTDEERRKIFNRYGIDPDRELLVWEKWIQIRKEETVKLGKCLIRPPVDLTMNLLENIREDKERKITLYDAQIPKMPKVRGQIWEQPPRLKQRCYTDNVYELQRTAAELGRPHIMEHIGVPQCIQELEKGLIGVPERKPCNQLDADYEKYWDKREEELKDKILKIDPYRPDIKELVVIGTKPKPPPKKKPHLPQISVTALNNLNAEALCGVYAIRINNTVILKTIPDQNLSHLKTMHHENWHEFCYYWTYYFNVSINRMGRARLFLENLGTVTLRYCWKKIKRSIPFIPEDIYEQFFFFNKNEDVLSPGQKKELYFTFISDKPGIYNESWELSMCNICFFDTLSDKLIINLSGDSTERVKINTKKIQKLKTKIARKAIHFFLTNLINDIVSIATSAEPQIYPYKHLFLEAELFVMKNPICFYHQTQVQYLKDRYTEMSSGAVWDLGISSWREKMIQKDYEERMQCYEFLKNSHRDLLRPWYEGNTLLEDKFRSIKLLLSQFFDKFDEEYAMISTRNGVIKKVPGENSIVSPVQMDDLTPDLIRNLFFLHMYEHLANTIELCAGILSSLDLNKWIEFDFCQW